MVEANASAISTHYYKLGRINSITYSVYGSSTNSDQALLELELSIRYKNPNILITYYNKCLYYFRLGNGESENLLDTYQELQFKYTNTVNVDLFSNPPKNSNNEDYLAFASLSFLKSLKKMILFNLSRKKVIKIFGNYSVIDVNQSNYLLYLDPILLSSGDLLISALTKSQLVLYDSSVLDLSNPEPNFVIYLIPSGIRCHFFDSKVSNNFVQKKISNESLLKFLEYSIGTFNIPEDTPWVKLIPNLKHLNNQTSKISKFIHEVDNKKYILWPWSLCLLQFGNYQPEDFESTIPNPNQNPMNLISDFIDFNILNNQNQNHSAQNPLSIPSAISTGLSSGGVVYTDRNKEIPFTEITDMGHTDTDIFNISNSNDFFNKDIIENKGFDKKGESEINGDDMEMDDLFGDGDDLHEDIEVLSENMVHEVGNEASEIQLDEKPLEIIDLQDSKDEKYDTIGELSDNKADPFAQKSTFIDIPKDQMTIRKIGSPIYNDPGAPLPIMPTPLIPQSVPTSSQSTNPPSTIPEDLNKSVFSPILFNPIIKSNIDTKYGKGGKFYVDKESSVGPDLEKLKSFRATSVSGAEITSKETENDINDRNVSSSDGSDESDEDEDVNTMLYSSPLKLNTMNESFTSKAPNYINAVTDSKLVFNLSNVNTEFASPIPSSISKFKNQKIESPYFFTDNNQSFSPFECEQNQLQLQPQSYTSSSSQAQSISNQQREPESEKNVIIGSEKEDPIKIVGESSNYLPLILRSINVTTVPNYFLLNNLVNNRLIPNFNISEVDNDNDDNFEDTKNNEMTIKSKNIDEFLKFLSPNLIFDYGLNSFKHKLKSNFDFPDSLVEYEKLDEHFEQKFIEVFPNCYKVKLIEFLKEPHDFESEGELDNQLNFLDEITNTDDLLNPKYLFKKLQVTEWDTFENSEKNKDNFNRYKSLIQELNSNLTVDSDSFFKLPVTKTRVYKNKNIINLNNAGLKFWDYLNFSPINEEKNLQILMISESGSFNNDFLNHLIYNYKDCNLGNISKVNISNESWPDLNSNNGLLLVSKDVGHGYSDFYRQVNQKLNSLAELIKLDLINKTNRFEFDRPLLLLFANFNENVNSLLQISKIFKNFKNTLDNHKLPLVNIFTKIIPGSLIVKQKFHQTSPRIIPNNKLTKLSMNIYNQCPNDLISKDLALNLFTQLVKEPPTKIQFKFSTFNSKDGNIYSSLSDDIFLHLAYERSIDRNWISAAWSDPLGIVTYNKSWYCSSLNLNQVKDGAILSSVIDEIWSISHELFKKLNDQIISKTSGLGGKKFLVLTRINSIIPDDELIHWKRLSVKHKDISLVVLSVNKSPKLIFSNDFSKNTMKDTPLGEPSEPQQTQKHMEKSTIDNYFKNSNASSNSPPAIPQGSAASPSNGLNFHSPQQFMNAAGFLLSPQDYSNSVSMNSNGSSPSNNQKDADMILEELGSDIFGVIPKIALPSFNSPTRLGMKIGYLLKEFNNDYLVFEVNLLSCSNYWDLNILMKTILCQYKKLIILNDLLGLRDMDGDIKSPANSNFENPNYEIEGLVPWHIAAVSKSLNYLVHICVED